MLSRKEPNKTEQQQLTIMNVFARGLMLNNWKLESYSMQETFLRKLSRRPEIKHAGVVLTGAQ